MANYKNKNCELCGKDFTPTSPKQKYCLACKEEGRRITDRKRDRKRSRKKYNYKEYTRICPSCGKEFITHYSKKIYCGDLECEIYRVIIKNKRGHANRDKNLLMEKGRIYYNENREACLLRKAERYRELNPEAKPYVSGKVHKHTIEYIRTYVESRGYKLLSEEYVNSKEKILLQCPEGHEWETTFHCFRDLPNSTGARCATCYQQNNYISKPEQMVRSFLETNLPFIDVEYNNRSVLSPKELDFYFPEHSLAIEVCGLHWHGDLSGKPRNYHYQKMMDCFDKGIRLITIFEDELLTNEGIVFSRIKQALGVQGRVIYARKCVLSEIDSKTANIFFEENHIQGKSTALVRYGLFYNDELVCVGSLGKFTRKHAGSAKALELKRFCTLKNTSVVGGIGKIFKAMRLFASANGYNEIKSYCDMRYGNINNPVYELLGFTLQTFTKYTPHYFKSGVRYRNISLRKTPEERLTGKTEWELRCDQGYDRIWDCGHRTYLYVLN